MRTREELNTINNGIYAARREYIKAVEDNLIEGGHPFGIDDPNNSDNGMALDIIGRHGEVRIVVDKVRATKNDIGGITTEVHICNEDYNHQDYWYDINNLNGDDSLYIYESIIWEGEESIVKVDGWTHNGTANAVYADTSIGLYFLFDDGALIRVADIDGMEDAKGTFCVHKDDYEQAMREIDEADNEREYMESTQEFDIKMTYTFTATKKVRAKNREEAISKAQEELCFPDYAKDALIDLAELNNLNWKEIKAE